MKRKALPVIALLACLGCGTAALAGCETAQHRHTWKDEVVAPTCTERGYTVHTCTDADCRDSYRDTYTEATSIHVPVTDSAVEVTCTTDGLTEGSHCRDCGGVIVEQHTVVSQGHKFTYTPNGDNATHNGECGNCDNKVIAARHVYVDGICSDCGYEFDQTAAFEFELGDDGKHYIISKYVSSVTDVVIPSVHNGLPVTAIGRSAFSKAGITGVVIPESITEIGIMAFAYNDFTSVVIPESVTKIGSSAFFHCVNLKNVTVPSSVTEIGGRTFEYCSLTYNEYEGGLYVGNQTQPYLYLVESTGTAQCIIHSQTKFIDSEFLFNNSFNMKYEVAAGNTVFKTVNTCLIDINNKTLLHGDKDSVIPADGSVTTIGSHAFYIPFEEFNAVIPNTVETIKVAAFHATRKLKSLHIPASVKLIEQGAFWAMEQLEEITVDSANSNYYVKNNCLIEKSTKILILGCKNSIIPLDEGITEIADYAFTSSDITEIILPDSVTRVGVGAFNACKKLTEAHMGKGLTVLDRSAFYACDYLYRLYLPASIKEIKKGALKSIGFDLIYDGTAAMWESIEKENGWREYSLFTVYCTDKVINYSPSE